MKDILVVWDVDGTLIDAKDCGREALNRTFYKIFGIENGFRGVSLSGRLDACIVEDALKQNNISYANMDLFFDTYVKILEDVIKNKKYIQILPGIKEILQCENQDHIFHILGTGNIERGARIKLKAHEIDEYFLLGGFGDDKVQRWQMVQKAIEKAQKFKEINYLNENIYVIGDTTKDIYCAKKLGVRSIAVSTGSDTKEELFKDEPDYLFENLGDIQKFFDLFL
ncbi:HAD family hydrolase [Inediibacterium massiliense]|uniref:HAD family hydrolase n=1 Tax=Inediibacterium massiliense TaxID=1658111 RepID=UPI0006B64D23|nr:HAD family hydrolase [Inediibacterium massiliense]